MKDVVYRKNFTQEDDIFTLTDNEFFEAMNSWKSKEDYWCPRLGCVLPKRYTFITTPKAHLEHTIYFLEGDESKREYIKANGKIFSIVGGIRASGITIEEKFKDEKLQKEFEKKLVSIDDFYDDFNNLNLGCKNKKLELK